MMASEPFLVFARKEFHRSLLKSLLTLNEAGVATNADKDSRASVAIAAGIAHRLAAETGSRLAGQTSGHQFEELVTEFLGATFLKLTHLRPGNWEVRQVAGRNRSEIANYSQYSHLIALQKAAAENYEIAAALGNDYTITPDVVITRGLESDAAVNREGPFVDASVAKLADLRAGGPLKSRMLHASISTKWTLRSDRAQNARSEALNLIRNRKGRQPHIVVVTAEPTPSRLSSLALGTGDIDCVYHIALDELQAAVTDFGNAEALDLLRSMVGGKRLKDIADLPLDLAV